VTLTAPVLPVNTPDDSAQALFREARRRRRRRLGMLGAIVAVLGVVGGLLASSGGTPPRPPRTAREGPGNPPAVAIGHFVLRGDGIGDAKFGEAQGDAILALDKVLGSPLHHRATNERGNCTIDAEMQWRPITAYFSRDRFVGYATVSIQGRELDSEAATAKGLHLGDPLALARLLYGPALTTSYAQGGSWFVATPMGRIAGILTAEVDQTSPGPRIADITAGSVGCPAASP
jgi:hypothetical protein